MAEVNAQQSKVVAAAKNGVPAVSEDFIRSLVSGGDEDHSADPVFMATSGSGGGATPGSGFTATPGGVAKSKAAAKAVMLAKVWEDGDDPTRWWISEKLDGVRAYWDGRDFYSRQGNPFPVPEWFKEGLPTDQALDGELWCGRQKFRQVKTTGASWGRTAEV